MKQQMRCALFASLAAASVSAAGPAYADVTTSGAVSPSNPSDPWYIGPEDLVVGQVIGPWEALPGEVDVTHQGTVNSDSATIIDGTILVSGYGSRWASTELGLYTDGSGRALLSVRDGAQVTTDNLSLYGHRFTDGAAVLVKGYGATLTSLGATSLSSNESYSDIRLEQGGRFFSKDLYLDGCLDCIVSVTAIGYGTTWVNTGEFISYAGRLSVGYEAKVFTVNAQLNGESHAPSSVVVSGWGATWNNQGALSVGASSGYAGIGIGTYGTLVTEETYLFSRNDETDLRVSGLHAPGSTAVA